MKSILFLLTASCAFGAVLPWPAFQVGQRVEIDVACGGTWLRATILTSGPDQYSKTATRYTAKFDRGDELSFSGPGIVAPCIRAMTPGATAPVAPFPGGPGQRLSGLYLQLQGIGTSYTHIHYYFWPDGRICQGLPSGGIDREPADFATIQQQEVCGQYRVAGTAMSIKWQGDPATHELRFANFQTDKVHGDSFEMNGYATAKVPTFAVNQRLNEPWYGFVDVGKQSRKQVYTFHADGTYQLDDQPVTSRDGAAKSESGTYRFIGNTLELARAAGISRITAYPFPNGGIKINDAVFSKH